MKKIISKSITMLLALCMVIGLVVTGSGENAIVNAATSSDGYTIITTAAELDSIRNNLSGKYRLGNDIDLSTYSYNSSTWTSAKGWLGIGTSQALAFTGTLDGDGYTISGLWSNSRGSNQGLFGWLSGATIKNLNIATTSVGIAGSGERKGVLAGNAYSSTTIDNVNVAYGVVTGSANYIAGLVGVVKASTVTNSTVNNITASGGSYVAGAFGVIYDGSSVSYTYVENADISSSASYGGGFIGEIYGTSNVSYCAVTNANVAVKTSYAGGFIGVIDGKSSVSNAAAENVNVSAKNGSYVGGFVGAIHNYASAYRCYAIGDNAVSATHYVGGWAGTIYGYATVEICCSYGTAATTSSYIAGGFAGEATNATISNCYAQVDATSKTSGAGGFIAYAAGSTSVYNTYSAGTVTAGSSTNVGAFVGHSTLTFSGTNYYDCSLCSLSGYGSGGTKSGSSSAYPQGYDTATMMKQVTFKGWDFIDIWRIDEGDTYPYFWNMYVGKVSQAPVINTINEGDWVVKGEGVAGATVTVQFPNGQEEQAVVDSNGTWQVNVPSGVSLVADEVVSAVQLENNKSESSRVYETVQGGLSYIPYADFYSIKNLTNSSISYIRPGDVVEYNIVVGNEGGTKSVWEDAAIVLTLAEQFDFSTAKIVINGTTATVGTGAGQYMYDGSTNELTLYFGDLAYMQEANAILTIQMDPNIPGNITNTFLSYIFL